MKTKIIGLFVSLGVIAGGAAGCDVEQPPAACPLPHTSVFVKYTPVDGTDECMFTGESWAISRYNVPGTTTNTIAIQPDTLAAFAGDPRLMEFSNTLIQGDFDFEATNEICVADNLGTTTVDLPEVTEALPDGGTDVTPAATVTYEVEQVEFVGTAQVPGTQFRGTLTRTAEGCTEQYNALGISPWVDCYQVDENGDPVEVNGELVPDDSLCNATRDEETGEVHPACNPFHECLNPDFNLKCDPVTLVCIPAGEIPSLVAAD